MLMLALMMTAVAGAAPLSTNPGVWERAIDYGRLTGGGMILPDVRIELTVDENGDPVHCAILQSDEAKGFDNRYCVVPMRRAHFRPARDEDGRPIAGVFSTDFQVHDPDRERRSEWVDYSLTVSSLPGAKPRTMAARVVTDAAGHVESCVVDRSSGMAMLDEAACRYTRASLKLTAPYDRDGRPVRAMRLVSVGFTTGAVPQ